MVVSEVRGDTQVNDALLQKYLATIKKRVNNFDSVEISHVPREQNTRADVLSKLARTRVSGINHYFVQETLAKPSYGMSAMVAIVKPIPGRSCGSKNDKEKSL